MGGFNYLMLVLAGFAVLVFALLVFLLAKRTRGQGLQPPDRRPPVTARPAAAVPPPPPSADAPPPYEGWRLMARTLANAGSAGGPLYRLRLEPEGELPQWNPGAVACIYCGPAEDVLTPGGEPLAPAGNYMVGTLPIDGAIELVVRRVPGAGPGGGRRSHWLCETLDAGQRVALALRDDPGFTPPPHEVPLILIGNATGIGGLHAHIRARPPGTRNWLIFGDRNSADDAALATEISEWVATGHLERCDLVLPGESGEKRMVTDQIADAQAPILDWVLAGAAIYVCGSSRMGDDVQAVLDELLGQDVLDAMREAGLYRCSVY